jgi:hypothetical protein
MAEQHKPTKVEVLDAFCQIFRAVTRPAVTVIFAAVIAQVVIDGIAPPIGFSTWPAPASFGGSATGRSSTSRTEA